MPFTVRSSGRLFLFAPDFQSGDHFVEIAFVEGEQAVQGGNLTVGHFGELLHDEVEQAFFGGLGLTQEIVRIGIIGDVREVVGRGSESLCDAVQGFFGQFAALTLHRTEIGAVFAGHGTETRHGDPALFGELADSAVVCGGHGGFSFACYSVSIIGVQPSKYRLFRAIKSSFSMISNRFLS